MACNCVPLVPVLVIVGAPAAAVEEGGGDRVRDNGCSGICVGDPNPAVVVGEGDLAGGENAGDREDGCDGLLGNSETPAPRDETDDGTVGLGAAAAGVIWIIWPVPVV